MKRRHANWLVAVALGLVVLRVVVQGAFGPNSSDWHALASASTGLLVIAAVLWVVTYLGERRTARRDLAK